MPVGPPIDVAINALAAGGDGVGRDESGRAVFVAMTAPGDVARVRVIEAHARWARGELIELVTPAAGRVDPPCPLFASRACGGCQWQHVTDAGQQAAKQAILAGALRTLIAGGMELRPLLAPVPPYSWRRRARWTVQRGAIGYHAPRGHEVCDVPRCPQLEPALEAVLVAIRASGAIQGDGEIHAIIGERDAAHVVLDVPCDPRAAAALVGQATIAGVAWTGGSARDDRGRPASTGGSAGADAIELETGLMARADEFAQASRAGNAALRALVREAVAARAGERVFELHAGGGNFTRDLVAAGAQVTPTDQQAPAVPPPGFVRGAAAEVVARLVREQARFDAILLDPPRTGAREVVDQLGALADRVIYVSCDPATFARDAAQLTAAGLVARWAQGIDLMPQTAHVELVARFDRP